MHSTNYTNTLIEIAADSKATQGKIPPLRGERSGERSGTYQKLCTRSKALLTSQKGNLVSERRL